jgi:hypothetical protein
MPLVSPSFAFALPFFANALKVLTEKAGRPKTEEFQVSTAGRFFGRPHPMAKNNNDEPRTLSCSPLNPRERPIAQGFCGCLLPAGALEAFCKSQKQAIRCSAKPII